MIKFKIKTTLWKLNFGHLSIENKITGVNFYLWQSLPTTISIKQTPATYFLSLTMMIIAAFFLKKTINFASSLK